MIPQDKIDEVIDRSPVVSVIGEYLTLKKRGANHIGLCPFHSEKTPSFSVNEAKNIFYCFGCHTGGNVVTFVMKKEGVSFPEAIRSLASRCGVTIEEYRSPDDGGKREALYKANKLAEEFFYRELRKSTGAGARAYLKKRGIDKDLAVRFRIGYAPPGWNGLADYLKENGIKPEVGVDAGLLSSKGEKSFDRFRSRVVFPIYDIRGRAVAFGGRGLEGEEPKYLNSAESPVFKKFDTLYGLNEARASISERGFVLVSEGYFDRVALVRAGFENSVATMGTALTASHIRKLKGFGAEIYTVFDGDEAGTKAAIRGLELFIAEDVPSKVVLLPAGKDPDDILRESGPGEMEILVKAAIPLMEFFIDKEAGARDLKTPGGKRELFNAIMPYLKLIANAAERAHYIESVAALLGIKADPIYAAIGGSASMPPTGKRAGGGVGAEGKDGISPGGGKYSLAEATILKVLLKHPELYGEEVRAAVALFKDPLLKNAAELIAAAIEEGPGVTTLTNSLDEVADETVRGWIAGAIVIEEEGFIEGPEQMINDSVRTVLTAGGLKEATMEQIRKFEEAGDVETATLMRERALKRALEERR